VILAVVEELLQAKVYGEVPPVPLAVAVPSLPPLQLTSLNDVDMTNNDDSLIVTLALDVHELSSVTVTV
jgi:hypothetical protein